MTVARSDWEATERRAGAPLRADLLEGYARPYARWLPIAYRANDVPQLTGYAGLLAVAAVLARDLEGGALSQLLTALAACAAALAVLWTVWTSVAAARLIRHRTRDWRPRGDELARVRARRPHAAEADRETAHDEYAVAVEELGELVTWRFTPLRFDERPPAGALAVPGTPVHAAVEMRRVRFDPEDAGRAAEQLADAQAAAARREAAAAEAARAQLRRRRVAEERSRETRSTARALRRHTGQ